nr:MAG TPA: hypothetical protein [Caudoviricetes sp.]
MWGCDKDDHPVTNTASVWKRRTQWHDRACRR